MPIVPLFGHAALLERLYLAHRRGTLPGSVLLHGPAGVGKQRLALELGRMILCTGAGDAAAGGHVTPPCGECQACRYSAELQHPDLHWFFPRERLKESDPDATTVRSVFADAIATRVAAGGLYPPPEPQHSLHIATMRTIVHLAQAAPAIGRYRVFVIGDAETMVSQESSPEGANVFLKLLEEPPPGLYLILASSEPGALLPTVKSRLVSVRVTPLGAEEIREFLGDPRVREAVGLGSVSGGRMSSRVDELVAVAGGAPGRLLSVEGTDEAMAAASRLLDAVMGNRKSQVYRAAFTQGSAGARGQYTVTLEALLTSLRETARSAVEAGDTYTASRAAAGISAIERARERAFGNISPQVATLEMLRELRVLLAR